MAEVNPWTAATIRERWEPSKQRLRAANRCEDTLIRLHRALSWLEHAERTPDESDDALLFAWVAFNALYGRWDLALNEPEPDRAGMGRFVERVCRLDAGGHIAAMLAAHRGLVRSILEDEWLSRWFWQDRTDERARKQRKSWYDAQTWYLEGRSDRILDRVLERIYLQRCQIVHGAATHGSRLNRVSLGRCRMMLAHIVAATLLVIIDHGAEEDWGPLCYPPTDDIVAAADGPGRSTAP